MAMSSQPIPRQSPIYDDGRNASRVRPVPPDALPQALGSLRRLRETDPLLVAWIEDGAPRMTHDEHISRFGETSRAPTARKGRA
jgi:hypothetical protein